ncbi:hypothetical protein KBX08_33155, partial [Micromonospora sp. H61]|uniref:hypothetical protein n=1 Tax=Micromonospora sp. H61 TaxID=2824888 RepID=UPI001B376EA7
VAARALRAMPAHPNRAGRVIATAELDGQDRVTALVQQLHCGMLIKSPALTSSEITQSSLAQDSQVMHH